MKNIRTTLIVIFISITVYFLKDLITVYWEIHNWYEIIVSYMLYLLLPTVFLVFLSFFSYKKDIGWNKKIAFAGMVIAALSFLSLTMLLVNVFING